MENQRFKEDLQSFVREFDDFLKTQSAPAPADLTGIHYTFEQLLWKLHASGGQMSLSEHHELVRRMREASAVFGLALDGEPARRRYQKLLDVSGVLNELLKKASMFASAGKTSRLSWFKEILGND